MTAEWIWAAVGVYWALGAALWIWFLRNTPLTWGRLVGSIAMGGVVGFVALGFLIALFIDAGFWRKPIFRKRERER